MTIAPPGGPVPQTGETEHLAKIHQAERLVDEVSETRERLRNDARRTLGVTGDDSKPPPLRKVLREEQVTVYPLFVLGLLAIVDTFQAYAFTTLTPEISRTLGIGFGTIT